MKKLYTILSFLFAFAATAQPTSIVVRNGGAYITINPGGAPIAVNRGGIERFYTAHFMAVYQSAADSLPQRLADAKAAGYNPLWVFGDYYVYQDILPILHICDSIGLKVIVGISASAPEDNFRLMITQTANHPAMFIYNGKPTYHIYHYTGRVGTSYGIPVVEGYPRNGFNIWCDPAYPVYYSYNDTWYPWVNAYPTYVGDVPYFFNTVAPEIDKILPFSVDKPTNDFGNINQENYYVATTSPVAGRIGGAGISANYASAQYYSFGYDSTLRLIKNILGLPFSQWPDIISETTYNDYAEGSYMGKLLGRAVNGLWFTPPLSAVSNYGEGTPYPILDHSGMHDFLLPWINKFKNSDTTPVVIDTDKLFLWTMLHPRDAAFMPTVPPFLADARPAILYPGDPSAEQTLQQWWNTTRYHGPVGRPATTADNLVANIKFAMPSNYSDIKMAAHMKAPGYLEISINGHTYRSGLQTGPDAYFAVPQELGTPMVRIIDANGSTRLTKTSPQAITNDCWPGGWGIMAIQL